MQLLDGVVVGGEDGQDAGQRGVEECGAAVGDFVQRHRVGFRGQRAVQQVLALVQLFHIFTAVIRDIVQDVGKFNKHDY